MIEQVYPRDFDTWLAAARAHGEPLVLDVREPWEWQTASVRADGFELMTLPMRAVPVRLHDLDRSRPIACLCHHGGRSMQVAAFLAHHGFEHVANIAGGIDAWAREKDPNLPRY
ncbi:rhodanese-like domain-containing protein [Tibeticola sp.]|uniref:rhodanese-like domain-containing protein n=1 Tax=Tibeticola sp. TaxID=2005368 RepID=UPI0025D41AD8|nr:rhodanese-like domain-containing protein [Tibeticola sp.]